MKFKNVPKNYKPSAGELDNLVYLICKYGANWEMKQADLSVCLMMAGETIGPEGIKHLVEVTCEYLWDHICGEPTEPTAKQIQKHVEPLLEEWYSKTTPEQRAITK